MDDSSDIRIGVVLDVDVMQKLGELAARRGVSVADVISSILSEAAEKAVPSMPSFLDDDIPTDIVTAKGKKR